MTWLVLLLLTPTVIMVMVLSTAFLLANHRDRKEAEEAQQDMTEEEADAVIAADDPWVSLEARDLADLEQFKDGEYHLTTEQQRGVYSALLASVEEDPSILDPDRRD